MHGYRKLRKYVLTKLEAELPESLTYHGFAHTMDVIRVCEQYIRREKLPETERYLLKIGAIVHDMGFLKGPLNHEEVGAGMAAELMQELGMKQEYIDRVRGMVLATKVPQAPTTNLQRIICDADLDYLGRNDYPEISERLFKELKFMGVLTSQKQWKDLQINFLRAHKFHTDFAIQYREPKKQKWLMKLLES